MTGRSLKSNSIHAVTLIAVVVIAYKSQEILVNRLGLHFSVNQQYVLVVLFELNTCLKHFN